MGRIIPKCFFLGGIEGFYEKKTNQKESAVNEKIKPLCEPLAEDSLVPVTKARVNEIFGTLKLLVKGNKISLTNVLIVKGIQKNHLSIYLQLAQEKLNSI